ncbi:MAG: AzlD domain-containing protein [Bacillota bacterium]|nr:AzlD domain-containing protein [Bacillota bacterium]
MPTIPTSQALIIIAIISIITISTRALPFILFDRRATPKIVLYLGKVMPTAIIAMLIVYCLKNVTPMSYPYGLPELIAGVVVVALHIWKRSNLLSIFGGTALYMFLVQVVFK